ncbi:phosphotransferase [Lutibacter sp. A80]|uniref:phosphotransferase n=1 Tax=Lutibacter sp. A80 TaxID=2918453 RepID=UPI001F0592A5|nr:phosphotransferase [Lutibacter sp. A80]UMB60406.1 phosphotransferase [Lutibacter sp. A80]
MTAFPVSASTLSENHLGKFVIENYNLPTNSTCKLYRTGINHTYFITTNNTKYALRVYSYNWRTKQEIKEELQLLNELATHNLSVSFPIKNKKGNLIQEINAPEGNRFVVLFSFAEGKKVRFMTPETCFKIGKLIAGFHKVTHNKNVNRINYTSETLVQFPYKYACNYYSEALPEMKFIKEQGNLICKLFKQADATQIKSGIVHLDIWYDNMNITNENEITIFDFDFCGNGWLLFDVAYFTNQLFNIELDKKEYELKLNHFLSGYQSILNLTKTELKLLPSAATAIQLFYLGVQAQRFDWSNIFLTENYLKMYVNRIKSWINYSKQ